MTRLRRLLWSLVVLILMAGTSGRAAADPLDPRMLAHAPERAPSQWDNLELRVLNFPHLKFDVGGLVSYRLNWVQVGVDYQSGHPAWALDRAPFLAMPVSIPVPYHLMPMPGVDMALRLNVPVVPLGAGARPPVEMDVNLTLKVDSMLRAIAPLVPASWMIRR